MDNSSYSCDAFLSHAVEDKTSIANELYSRLKKANVNVWYSGIDLKPGDNIDDAVRKGLTGSKYGIVIFSRFFLDKNWTMKEYHTMEHLESLNQMTILPILYEVTPEDLASKDVKMAGRFAVNYNKGMDHVVARLLERINGSQPSPPIQKNRRSRLVWVAAGLACILLAALILSTKMICWDCPKKSELTEAIADRIKNLEVRINKEWLIPNIESPIISTSVDSIFSGYQNLKSNYRNEYEFTNGATLLHSRRSVESALGADLTLWRPANDYTFKNPIVTLGRQPNYVTFTYRNIEPVTYSISKEELKDNSYFVNVSYVNNIRCIKVSLSFPTEGDRMKRHRMRLIGFLPDEQFVFEKKGDKWILTELR